MRKFGLRKTALITAGIMFGAGALIFGLGLATGGSMNFGINYQEKKVYLSKDINGSDKKYITDEIKLDEFKKLDLDVDTANVDVVTGDSWKVSYKLPERADFSAKVEGDTLKLTEKQKAFSGVNFNIFDWSGDYSIEITVPEGTSLEDAKMIVNTGDVSLNSMDVKNLDIEADTGNADMKDMSGEKITISADTGNVKFMNVSAKACNISADTGNIDMNQSALGDLEVNADTGNIKFDSLSFTSAVLDADTGNIKGSLSGKEEEYSYDIEASFGKIVLNGDKKSEDGDSEYKEKNGTSPEMKASADTGNVEISFTK